MVDYLFDTIKESEQKIVKDTSLSTIEKIRHILGVMPESYKEIDFGQLYLYRVKKVINHIKKQRILIRKHIINRFLAHTKNRCKVVHSKLQSFFIKSGNCRL